MRLWLLSVLTLALAGQVGASSCRPAQESIYFQCTNDPCELAFATAHKAGWGLCGRYWSFEAIEPERAHRLKRILAHVRASERPGLYRMNLIRPSPAYQDSWVEARLDRKGMLGRLENEPGKLSKADRDELLDAIAGADGATVARVNDQSDTTAVIALQERLSADFQRQWAADLKQFALRNAPAAPLALWLLYSGAKIGLNLTIVLCWVGLQCRQRLAMKPVAVFGIGVETDLRPPWRAVAKRLFGQLLVVLISLPALGLQEPEWLITVGRLAATMLLLELPLVALTGLMQAVLALVPSRQVLPIK